MIYGCCRDTVDSVGLLPKRLPFTTSNNIVRTFRHAVSLDERRAKFKANLWNRPTAQEAKLGINAASSSATGTIPAPAPILSPTAKDKNTPGGTTCSPRPKDQQRKSTNRQKELQDEKVLTALEKTYSVKHDRPTDVEEVWFSVGHHYSPVSLEILSHFCAGLSLRYVQKGHTAS